MHQLLTQILTVIASHIVAGSETPYSINVIICGGRETAAYDDLHSSVCLNRTLRVGRIRA